ncbi:MAG: hypothetical protein KAS71_03375, partial [Bacteroidales bacterium]|nr:hypothetical protein [Bacteroidales bacterium]
MQRKDNKIFILVTILLLFSYKLGFGQFMAPMKLMESGERLYLFTDRALYSVSEKLFFSAFYNQPPQTELAKWSTVLYAELIKWDGTKLVQSKVPIKNGFADGFINIPENIKSGNYYLRVYTKWMRNYSPYSYSYIPVKIVNPHVREIDKRPESTDQIVHIENKRDSNISEDIIISGIEPTYRRRQLVEFEVSILTKQLSGPYCLSVAKLENNNKVAGSYSFAGYENIDFNKEVEYLPEINSLSLSGKVIDRSTKKPLTEEEIILTSTLNPFFFSTLESYSDGSFLFSLPEYEGSHQFCLSLGNEELDEVEFQIGNDFCNQPVILPYTPFELNTEEEIIVEEISTNAQLSKKFYNIHSSNNEKESYYPFYGKAQGITYVNDFVELIDLKEFFFEIIMNVFIRYEKKEPYLKLDDMSSMCNFSPLVLLDNIPVPNDKRLLSIPTNRIDRIEVINGGYAVGNNMYSGIISIYSNNRDLAGMDLNMNLQFFNYQLFSDNVHSFPEYSYDNFSRMADMRNL